MATRSALLNVMVKAAEKAAKGLVRDFGEVEHLQVSRKGPGDFVSNADMQAQKVLREELAKARPNFGFLAEEKDGAVDTSGKAERWIIDPLDGTTNFLHGIGHWAISIAAEREGELIAGVIYDPIKNELFTAEKGIGAYLNNRRLRVSARTDLLDCLLATGIPFAGCPVHDFIPELRAVMTKVSGVRRFGAAALDLAYVAAGRYDTYWERNIKPWDIAAGIVLVREAGGVIAPMQVGKNPMVDGGIIASAGGVYEAVVKLLRNPS